MRIIERAKPVSPSEDELRRPDTVRTLAETPNEPKIGRIPPFLSRNPSRKIIDRGVGDQRKIQYDF
jgi:hypothetical protein